MLWHNQLHLFFSHLDKEGRDVPDRGTLIYKTVLDIVGASTSRADQLLSQDGACCQVSVVKATETSCSIVFIVVLDNNDLVSGVELGFIKGIANTDLNHLSIPQQIDRADLDRPIFLVLHHASLRPSVWVPDVQLLVSEPIPEIILIHLRFLRISINIAPSLCFLLFLVRSLATRLVLHAEESVEFMHLLEVTVTYVFFYLEQVLVLTLLVLFQLGLFSLLQEQRDLHGVFQFFL